MSDEQIQKALAEEIPVEDLSEADQETVRAVEQLARERHEELVAEYHSTKYTYSVEWAEDVRRWRARCDQLQGLDHPATTPEAAIRGAISLVGRIIKNGQEGWWTDREVDEALDHGTDPNVRRTVPTGAKIDYDADNFYRDPPTMYLIALPLHLAPGYDVQIQPDLGYFLNPYEAASEARRRLEFQVENAPVEHRHNFAVSGAAVIPVHPHGVQPRFDLKPWPVRLARKDET